MMNKNGNYTLHCGDKKYEVTPDVKNTLEAVIYWTHCENIDSAELNAAKKDSSERERRGEKPLYTDEEIHELQCEVAEDRASVNDFMLKMEEQGVPNWVGNGAMAWAKNNDLRVHGMNEFFEKSAYAKEQKSTKNIDR